MAEQQPLQSNSDQATTKETTIENGNCHRLGLSAPTWQVEESPVALNPSVVPPPPPPPPTKLLHCPRCDSTNTKFCYYNNYSLMQPRHYCKTCKRYWTKGGAIRNVPMGGRSRKPKRPRNDSSSVSFSNDVGMTNPTISPPSPISFSLAQPNQQFQLHQQYFLNNANAGGMLGGNDGSGYRRGLQLPPIPNGIPMIQPHGNHGNLHRQMSSMGPNHEHLINYQATTGVEEGSLPGQAPFMMPTGGMPARGNGSGFLAPSMMMGGFGSSSTITSDTIPYNWPPRSANVNHISSSAMTSPTFSTATAAATSVGEYEEDNEFMRWQKEENNQKNLN